MKEPSYQKLENLINRMVEDRVSEGQLSDCPLTFHHLQVIKETFLNILVGIYHSRVEYPDDKKDKKEGKEKKASSQKKEKGKDKEKENEKPSTDKQGSEKPKEDDGSTENLPRTINS